MVQFQRERSFYIVSWRDGSNILGGPNYGIYQTYFKLEGYLNPLANLIGHFSVVVYLFIISNNGIVIFCDQPIQWKYADE